MLFIHSSLVFRGFRGSELVRNRRPGALRSHRQSSVCTKMTGTWNYPDARRDESVVEELHGESIADPYRWMEDPDSEETKAWVDKQNELSREYVAGPVRESVLSKLQTMNEYEKIGCPFRVGKEFMFMRKDGQQNQHVLYVQKDLEAEPKVALDPNTFSEDGSASLGELDTSDDGKLLAYSVSLSGSDWRTIHVLDLESGKEIPGSCDWARYTSIAWVHDGSGFYYCRFPETDADKSLEDRGKSTAEVKHQMICFHKVGTPQEEDRIVYTDGENPDWTFNAQVTDDGGYLLIGVSASCAPQQKLLMVNLSEHFGNEAENVVPIFDDFQGEYSYIANDGITFYLRTNLNAPKNQIIKLNIEEKTFEKLIPEHETDVLVKAEAVDKDKMLLVYQRDVKHVLELRTLIDGELIRPIPLPDLGCVAVSSRRRDSDFFFKFTSFIDPGSIYHVDLAKEDEPKLFRQVKVPDHDPSEYETDQVFYKSKDGTKVPMFIVKKKTTTLPAPCELYGYGGFMISLTPQFSLLQLCWIRSFGGVLVVANLRGGDEYGEAWHNAGIVDKKQNVFDDFQEAAKHLVESGVTTKEKLWILGGSNGGLLVGACVNQAPELYGAAVAQVGVMDMLRFHKFGIGRFWVSDFGNPDEAKDFEHIHKYSPLHNVQNPSETNQAYPPTLLMTADHDDRVAPLHSYKYAAELQYRAGSAESQEAPLMLLVDTKAGHGAGKPTAKVLEEAADRYAFISRAIDAPLVE